MPRTRRKTRGAFRIDSEFKAIVVFLAPELRRQVLIELGHGLTTPRELAARLNVPSSRVAYQLKRLTGRKLVQRRGQGRRRSYRLGSAVQVTAQGKRDVLTVSIKGNSISVSPGPKPKEAAPRK